MVMLFETTNGFHDAANAVATVIYTKSLKPVQAVVWSGFMNFLGVLIGGIAVAYALVELLPAEVLTPPDGGPAVAMLVSLFVVALGNALARSRSLAAGVHWPQLWKVLEALALSPLLGFVLAGALYLLTRKTIHDKHLYQPAGDKPPIWWMRAILILTCTGVSFAHGTNDGQKSIGLIMLTIIGIFPAAYALNPAAGVSLNDLPALMQQAEPLMQSYGDEQKATALASAKSIEARFERGAAGAHLEGTGTAKTTRLAKLEIGLKSDMAKRRSSVRGDVYQVLSELKHVEEAAG